MDTGAFHVGQRLKVSLKGHEDEGKFLTFVENTYDEVILASGTTLEVVKVWPLYLTCKIEEIPKGSPSVEQGTKVDIAKYLLERLESIS